MGFPCQSWKETGIQKRGVQDGRGSAESSKPRRGSTRLSLRVIELETCMASFAVACMADACTNLACLACLPTGQKVSEEEIDDMIETGEAENIFQKAILTDQVGAGAHRLLASCS